MLHIIMIALAILGLMSTEPAIADGQVCQQFISNTEGAGLDLAPPTGFVEICGQDAELCRVLTAGYPSNAKTIGYFVMSEEWEQFKKAPIGFSRYLIAQRAGSTSPEDFPDLKEFIRSRQGGIADHTTLPSLLESQGRVPIGVFEDASDAIAFGTVMKLRATPPAPQKDLAIASTNTAFVVKGKVLSLYVFINVTETMDVEAVKELTRRWLGCLRAANPP